MTSALVRALASGDTDSVADAVRRLRELALVATRPDRLHYAAGLGGLLLHDLTGDGYALDQAIADLEDTRAAQPAGSGAASAGELMRSLHRAYRHRRAGPEDRQAATDAGLAALVEDVGAVFLHNGAVDGLRAARGVGDFAHGLALDCLVEEDPEAAMTALELGRGLVLHAATATAGLPDLLDTAGFPDLAAQWRAAPPPAPIGPDAQAALLRALDPDAAEDASNLRRRTLDALAGTPMGRVLFSTCDAGAVAAALRATGRDALVYLLGGDADRPGWALIVTAGGGLRSVELPGLRLGAGGPLDAWIAGPGDPTAFDELCRWAGLCVVGPVLARLPAGEPRITLVPSGPLAAVPWHAARLRPAAGSGPRACELATLSRAATGQQFVDLAHRPRLPLPTRRHPTVTWTGTPEELLRHLPGAPVLHIGAEAVTADPPLTSYLELADGRRLSVAQMLTQAHGRPPTAAGGLVLLSTCRAEIAISAYDESLTIGNAFIAAGAAGVIASLWPVPDRPTTLLMHVLHDRLHHGDPPDLALQATQRWMLDPHREIPDALPATLTETVRSADLSDPTVWAAFTCQA